MELWAHNIDFTGFDVRFKYNSTYIKPSAMANNQIITIVDETSLNSTFVFEEEFRDYLYLDAFSIPYDGTGTGIRAVLSFKEDEGNGTSSDHVKTSSNGAKQITTGTDGEVLIGKMSFQMLTEDLFNKDWFSLEPKTDSEPKTRSENYARCSRGRYILL